MTNSVVENARLEQERRINNMETAETILKQLGGGRFKVMTGAKNFCAIENGLSFRIPKTPASPINYVEIKVNGLDLYDLTFKRIYRSKVEKISDASDISCDQLQAVFTKNTGYDTHL
jgi:hypothetical protein